MKRLLKNRYEILETLGRGGMGCVYKVSDRQQRGKILAIKEFRPGTLPLDRAGESLIQFQTEARILARFTHPNLPKVYDYFSLGSAYYIVMEYINGKTLEQILNARHGRPFDEQLALSWALQICRAMHFLSVQKPRPIVFRDLKPSNIMIARDGRVKLIDFGIARFFKENKREDTYVYGTPGYAAPEQYGSAQTDVRSDIFSLGATLHHCFTGRNPSQNPLHFTPLRKLNPAISKEAAAIVMKAVAFEMSDRFQSALEMKQAIQKKLLESAKKMKTGKRIIHAETGRMITLPWWQRVSWVSVPVASLGCSGTTGTLSTEALWIQPRPRAFGTDAARLLFRVENKKLKLGKEYPLRITVHTEAGIYRPQLIFKKSWPWLVLEAAVLAAVVAVTVVFFIP